MTPSELLHHYLDDGLPPEQEETLFAGLAADPELRAEFSGHIRLNSMIQADIRAVTTPSGLTASLFAGLGLKTMSIPGETASAARPPGSMPSRIKRLLPHAITAVLTALLTGGALFVYSGSRPMRENGSSSASLQGSNESLRPNRETEATFMAAAEGQAAHRDFVDNGPGQKIAARPEMTIALDNLAAMPPSNPPPTVCRSGETAGPGEAKTTPAGIGIPQPDPGRNAAALALERSSSIEDVREIQPLPANAPEPLEIAAVQRSRILDWNESGGFLSNLIFEMRILNSRSWPDVDLPYNSHDLFKDMAISAVYKISENHAFGVEYGRETFGQEYESMVFLDNAPTEDPIRLVYSPPAPWIAGVVQRNKMLDWYGLVWKVSLPEFGILNFVFPYARALAGATELGPLLKLRTGLEMYPTNYSMFNLGLEGTMLHYSVDGAWNNTWKLGVTFGLAVGF